MASPFCNGCGATITDITRFCVKCGQAVGQEMPPPAQPVAALTTTVFPPVPTNVSGSGVGIWIGIAAVVLLSCGAALWVYATRTPRSKPVATLQVAAAPTEPASVPPEPVHEIPYNPVVASPKPAAPVHLPLARPEHPPKAADPVPPPEPVAPRPAKPASPTSGVLHASVEVTQNGEVVFENLPGARLKFTFDREAWRPTISRQANGTQTLIMRSLNPGIQRSCDVQWEIVASSQ